MCRHFLSVLQCTAIGKVSGDAGRAERVSADRRVNAGATARRRIIRHESDIHSNSMIEAALTSRHASQSLHATRSSFVDIR